MNLITKFPEPYSLNCDDTKRFQAMSPEERMSVLCEVLAAGELFIQNSGNAAAIEAYILEEENAGKQAVRDFIARHMPPDEPILVDA